jgi:hypothetical protein
MTIGELRDELEDWPESYEIIFGCEELEFYRFKKRGADTVQLEFNQTISKMQRQASGMSMNRLPPLPPHCSVSLPQTLPVEATGTERSWSDYGPYRSVLKTMFKVISRK